MWAPDNFARAEDAYLREPEDDEDPAEIGDPDAYYEQMEEGGTWTLLDRPEPPREPGTVWRNPQTAVVYACVYSEGSFEYVPYPAYVTGPEHAHVLVEYDSDDGEIIARLERVES